MNNEIKYGICVIQFNEFANPNLMAELAEEAENAGWNGIFVCDHLLFSREQLQPIADPWITMSAIAARTEKIKIGTYVTPAPRYHPWQLAKLTSTLDILSNGRLILGVGLGGPPIEYNAFGEDYDLKNLAEKLDETLDILEGLWSGESFSYSGKHFQIDNVCFLPKPVQFPRIPIIIAGMWPAMKPFRRAAKYDGAMPIHSKFPRPLNQKELEEVIDQIKAHRESIESYDIFLSGTSLDNPERGKENILSFKNLGITWWLEHINNWMGPVEEMRRRIRLGPPNV